jgi:hypothetical protein
LSQCDTDNSGAALVVVLLASRHTTGLHGYVSLMSVTQRKILTVTPDQLLSLIGHASRGLLWLLLLHSSSELVNAAPAHGTDSLGAVSSESKICSEIGIELLRRGVSS